MAMPVPPGPVAITVSFAAEKLMIGVPEITPVAAFKDKPFGRMLPELRV